MDPVQRPSAPQPENITSFEGDSWKYAYLAKEQTSSSPILSFIMRASGGLIKTEHQAGSVAVVIAILFFIAAIVIAVISTRPTPQPAFDYHQVQQLVP